MALPLDLTGQRFHFLTALYPCKHPKTGRRMWVLRCDCGGEVRAFAGAVRAGQHKGCGCGIGRLTHGMSRSRVYRTWCDMWRRCSDPDHPSYHRYGGRGISVCQGWTSFIPFHAWAVSAGYSDSLEIDRIDNDGNYTPDNCRFVTRLQNARNRAARRS